MLARIAHDVYWLGRHLVRAEHTARMLDGLFHSDLQGRFNDPASVVLSWDGLLAVMGAKRVRAGEQPARRDEVVSALSLDPANPVSIRSCVTAARERARTVRDTLSAEMWESVNTYYLTLEGGGVSGRLRRGPYSVCTHVKERSALFWGLVARTMQKDEARAFLEAGGRIESADMLLRMLRVALPPWDQEGGPDAPRRDGNALALLRAVGGFQAFVRSAAAPPDAGPVSRFLLYERDFPDSVAASCESLQSALERVDPAPHQSPPLLRVRRALVDLDFRAGVTPGENQVAPSLRPLQKELERVDGEIDERYFALGAATPMHA